METGLLLMKSYRLIKNNAESTKMKKYEKEQWDANYVRVMTLPPPASPLVKMDRKILS